MRLEASTAARGATMAASLASAGGHAAPGLSIRKSEEIADLIDLFSKMQYRAKEATPRVSFFWGVSRLPDSRSSSLWIIRAVLRNQGN